MTIKSVVSDLQGVLDLAVKKGETQLVFSERLARKANDMENEDWETLDNDTQLWVNAAIEAISRSEAIPLPSGIEFLIPDEEAEEAPAPTKKKVNGKKPVKAVAEPEPEEEEEAPPQEDEAEEEPAPAPVKAKKAKVVPAEPEEAPARGPRGKFSATDKIKILAKENPFREGTKANASFSKIENGMTLTEALAAGAPRSHIRWVHSLGHIKIG